MDKELFSSILAGQVRNGIGLVAGSLITLGAVAPEQKGAFVQIGSGIVMWFIVAAWSWWQKSGQQQVREMLKHLTARSTTAGAIETAKAADAGAAVKAIALLIGLAIFGLISQPLFAADLPLKALAFSQVSTPCLPTSCTGLFAGGSITGAMTSANVIGNGINGSLAGGGQSIGMQGGYQYANGTLFFAGELSASYVTNGGINTDNSAPARFRVMEVAKVGTALATLLGIAGPQNSATPPVPSQFVASIISPYILVGAVQSGIGNGWATGAGVEIALTDAWFLDSRYSYIDYGSKSLTPNVVAKSENLVTLGINYKFK